MDLSNWKFRASSLGQLCGTIKPNLTDKQIETLEGLKEKQSLYVQQGKILAAGDQKKLGSLLEKKDAKPKLLATAQKYCDQIIQEQIFGRSYDIKSKYLDKGISQEIISLQLYQEVMNEMLFKNDENFRNDFFTGTPDSLIDGRVVDIKTSWDFTTFPMNDETINNNAYIYQLQAYMNLTGLDKSQLVYCLVDTPFNLIDDELRRLSWDSGCTSLDSVPANVKAEVVENLIYTEKGLKEYCHQSTDVEIEWFTNFKEIKAEHRLKSFDLYYDPKLVEQIKEYVVLGRNYLTKSLRKLAA